MLAIIAAFEEEIAAYIQEQNFTVVSKDPPLRFYESNEVPNVVAVDGAFGKTLAEEATRKTIDLYKPECILSTGFAGGTQKGLAPGDLFICDRLLSMDGPASMWGTLEPNERTDLRVNLPDSMIQSAGQTNPSFHIGGCMSVTQIVPSSQMKEWIGSTYSVNVIDMESYWINETALTLGVPNIVLKSVLDPMDQTLPKFVGEATSVQDNHRVMRAIGYLATNISDTAMLIKLSKQVKIASDSINRFLQQSVASGMLLPEPSKG